MGQSWGADSCSFSQGDWRAMGHCILATVSTSWWRRVWSYRRHYCTSSFISFDPPRECVKQGDSCCYSQLKMRERESFEATSSHVLFFCYFPSERIERRNAFLEADHITASAVGQKPLRSYAVLILNLFLRPWFYFAPWSVSEAVVFACSYILNN